ncbi:MAG: hypothetical protein LBG80_09365, partial [Bacteroidales bacterium]|nr:hypothetical protein [Bacteroidales bacterium]
MKSLFRNITFSIVAILLLIPFFGCYNAQTRYARATSVIIDSILQPTVFYPKTFDEQGRLYYYVKVFGVLKFFLSEKPAQDVNTLFWDYYQAIKTSSSKEHFNQNIQNLISSVHPDIRSMLQKDISTVDWANDTVYFDNTTAQYIATIEYCFRQDEKKSFYVKQNQLGIVEIIPPKASSFINDTFPKEALRLWTMADYWNYINYFWVHKKLMDHNWDSVLYVNVPNFVNAQNRREYILAVYRFIAYTDDTHVYFRNSDTTIAGHYIPNVRLTKIDNQFIVKKLRTNRTLIPSDTMLHVGDVIHTVNGIELSTYYDSLKHYFSASNHGTKVKKVAGYLLASFSPTNEVIISRNEIKDTLKLLFCHYKDYDYYEYD